MVDLYAFRRLFWTRMRPLGGNWSTARDRLAKHDAAFGPRENQESIRSGLIEQRLSRRTIVEHSLFSLRRFQIGQLFFVFGRP